MIPTHFNRLGLNCKKRPYKRQVTYLKGAGSQFIDLGITADPDFVINAEFMLTSTTAAQAVFGAYQNNSGMFFNISDDGTAYANDTESSALPITLSANTRYQLEQRGSSLTLNGSDYDIVAPTASSNNMLLFCRNRDKVAELCMQGIIFYFQVRKNGSLIRDLIPVIDWDNCPAMYDKVSGQLFYNQGHHNFLIDPEDWLDDEVFTLDINIALDNLQFSVESFGLCEIIDWGDGAGDLTLSMGSLTYTHTYSNPGRYLIKIFGSMSSFRIGAINPGALIDCNGNWKALGDVTSGSNMFQNCVNAILSFKSLPDNLLYMNSMFYGCVNALLPINAIPDGVREMYHAFNGCEKAVTIITKLPSGLVSGSLSGTFENCESMTLDLDAVASNQSGTWPHGDIVYAFSNLGAGNVPGTCTGSIASFMRKFPNIFVFYDAFLNTNAMPFGSNDYFEITLTTVEPNQTWGFAATSTKGKWYCFDWGDATPITNNRNLDTFVNGARVEHVFETPGTYHIKLATAPCAIVFDEYDSDNGNWTALGKIEEPIDGVQGVFIKSGEEIISSAMYMSGTTITAGQSQILYQGGIASNTTVQSNGALVASGGIAQTVVTSPGAVLDVYQGALIENLNAENNANGSIDFHSMAAIRNAYVSSGMPSFTSMAVMDHYTQQEGTLSAIDVSMTALSTINAALQVSSCTMSGWTMVRLKNGGTTPTINSATISNFIFSITTNNASYSMTMNGCSCVSGFIYDGIRANMYFGSTTYIQDVTIGRTADNKGSSILQLLGNVTGNSKVVAASNITVISGGTVKFEGGRIVHELHVSGGMAYTGGTGGLNINDIVVAAGTCTLGTPGTVATDVVVSSGGSLIISSGNTAFNVTSNEGAVVSVLEGGEIHYVGEILPIYGYQGVFVLNGNSVILSNAMHFDEVALNGNQLHVFNSGTVINVTSVTGGTIIVNSGGYIGSAINASNSKLTTVISEGGYIGELTLRSYNNGINISGHGGSIGVLRTSQLSGKLGVCGPVSVGTFYQSSYGGGSWYNGAVCSQAYVYGNHFRISSGGTALAVTVYDGGHVSVYAGGTALNVVNSGGEVVNVGGGGYIEYAE